MEHPSNSKTAAQKECLGFKEDLNLRQSTLLRMWSECMLFKECKRKRCWNQYGPSDRE